jgi:hypothetical protein
MILPFPRLKARRLFCEFSRAFKTELKQTKEDTQSNKVPNHSQVNKRKVMGMFWLFYFKFRNLSFLGDVTCDSS